jgi:hypothetical protein
MEIYEHGGECCGVRHISDFYGKYLNFGSRVRAIVSELNSVRLIGDLIGDFDCNCDNDEDCYCESEYEHSPEEGQSYLFEAIHAGEQIKVWERAMLAVGFKPVTEFINRNTGNLCRVYHLLYERPLDADAIVKANTKPRKPRVLKAQTRARSKTETVGRSSP